jgi:hypothetical protein
VAVELSVATARQVEFIDAPDDRRAMLRLGVAERVTATVESLAR